MASWMNWFGRRRADKLSHANALRRLAGIGYVPRVIYDIGAHRGGWTKLAAEVFPDATFALFEANADHERDLMTLGRDYFIAALGAEDGASRPFYLPHAGDVSGASLYRENSAPYAAPNLVARTVVTTRLDTIVARNRLAVPELVKLDVQGAELDVLAGATKTLGACQALIAEVSFAAYNKSAPLMVEMMRGIAGHGFRPVDMCELHRDRAGVVLQADFLFARDALFTRYGQAAGLL